MVKKKQMSGKWVVVDADDQVHPYSTFNEALKQPGGRVRIMTEEFYKTRYKAPQGEKIGLDRQRYQLTLTRP